MLAQLHSTAAGYGPILFTIVLALGMAGAILLVTHWPSKYQRSGAVKDSPYESGMVPIGDARSRFNVRFYLVAMLFLLFDVELIFMYPWAVVFFKSAELGAPGPAQSPLVAALGDFRTFLLVEMAIFMAILLVGYFYAWKRGIFRWE